MAVGSTKVVQVTNIAPQATKDQMQVLFGYLGKIEDIRLYPTVRDVSIPVQSRICYIKFTDPITVGIAQHMTNTVFIDRALIVIPVQNGEIPDEYYALEMTRNGTIVPGLNVNEPKLPPHVVNSVHGSGAEQVILTIDSTLDTNCLPNYPPLPATFDSVKVEETRRTILVQNISATITTEEWIHHFTQAGEIKYLRTCMRALDNSCHLLIEFTDQGSIINALKMDGTEFKGSMLQLQHATQPINKPQAKSNEAAQKEIEEAMTRFKEAQNMINASIEPVIGMLTKDKKSSRRSRSRSRSRDRRRRRSRSRSRRRSRSSRRRRSSSRKRSRSRERRRRSKSRSRRRSRSRSKRRSGSRRRSRSRSKKPSRSRERKSRPRSKERRSRDKSKERKRSKEREKSKERQRSKERKSRSESKAKAPESKERKSESMDIERKRSKSKSRSRSRKRSRSRDKRPERRRSRSRASRKRSPTPPRSSRRRSRSKSRDRDRESKRKERKERKRSRSRTKSRDRKTKQRAKSRSKSRSRSKASREEEKQSDNSKVLEAMEETEKDSGEKSDNMDISNSP